MKGFNLACFLIICLLSTSFALPRAKEYHGKLNPAGLDQPVEKTWDSAAASMLPSTNLLVRGEPSCEELRAMWRLSKRQSRATEITNELPTYRDPFAYNIWEPYGRSRSIPNRSVYGRLVHAAPKTRPRDTSRQISRAFEEVARLYGTVPHMNGASRRKASQASYRGGQPFHSSSPQAGSFQQLKDLIRSERARELQEQRMAEEAAASRAMSAKDNQPAYYGRVIHGDQEPHHVGRYEYGPRKGVGVLTFPDLLAPAAANYVEGHLLGPLQMNPFYRGILPADFSVSFMIIFFISRDYSF